MTGWMIEKHDSEWTPLGLYAGVCDGKMRWLDDEKAFRFCRQMDAIRVGELLKIAGNWAATEHRWEDG